MFSYRMHGCMGCMYRHLLIFPKNKKRDIAFWTSFDPPDPQHQPSHLPKTFWNSSLFYVLLQFVVFVCCSFVALFFTFFVVVCSFVLLVDLCMCVRPPTGGHLSYDRTCTLHLMFYKLKLRARGSVTGRGNPSKTLNNRDTIGTTQIEQ